MNNPRRNCLRLPPRRTRTWSPLEPYGTSVSSGGSWAASRRVSYATDAAPSSWFHHPHDHCSGRPACPASRSTASVGASTSALTFRVDRDGATRAAPW